MVSDRSATTAIRLLIALVAIAGSLRAEPAGAALLSAKFGPAPGCSPPRDAVAYLAEEILAQIAAEVAAMPLPFDELQSRGGASDSPVPAPAPSPPPWPEPPGWPPADALVPGSCTAGSSTSAGGSSSAGHGGAAMFSGTVGLPEPGPVARLPYARAAQPRSCDIGPPTPPPRQAIAMH